MCGLQVEAAAQAPFCAPAPAGATAPPGPSSPEAAPQQATIKAAITKAAAAVMAVLSGGGWEVVGGLLGVLALSNHTRREKKALTEN